MNDFLQRILALPPEKKRILAEHNPLSFAQQRLWFIDQLAPGSASYNVPSSLRLIGALNEDALSKALNEIIRRHGTLRTCFPAFGGKPLQVVLPSLAIDINLFDVSQLAEAEREEEVRRVASEEARKPFNLATGPLIRATLYRVAQQDHLLLVVIHHIVSDGWSLGVVTHELTALYNAYAKGGVSPLEELPIQYTDFAVWQRQLLQNDVLEKQLGYWRERLAGDLPALEMPADHARPATQSFRGAKARSILDPGLTDKLHNLAKREGVTLFMVMLAAFKALLHRYTGQEDISVGSPIANRNRKELEGLIGFFVNSLVLRDKVTSDMTFRALLNKVKDTALGAYDHQDLPFEKIVEEVNPERDMSRNPLFQVIFAVQNAPRKPLELEGLKIGTQDYEVVTTRLDLELHIFQSPEGLRCIVFYSIDLFEAATVERLLRHYKQLLDGIVADCDRKISEYSLLSEGERTRVVKAFNETRAAYDRDATIHACFEKQVSKRPNAVAVVDGAKQISYSELNRWANGIAQWLRGRNLAPEARVGILANRSAATVAAVLGVLKAGAAYLPLDPAFPPRRLRELLDDGEAACMLTDAAFAAMIGDDARPQLMLDGEGASLRADSAGDAIVSAGNLAYVMYTSGSTGKPKGVCVEHRNVVRLVQQSNYAALDEHTSALVYAPLAFDASTFELFGPLLNGGKLVLQAPGAASLEELAATIQTNGVNLLWLTTGLFHQMVERGPLDKLSGLKQLITGGDVVLAGAVRRALEALPNCLVSNAYGPTECTTFATTHPIRCLDEVQDPLPIGKPLQNSSVYVLDEALQPMPIGVPGELYIGGDGVARGYLNRDELTAERFVADPFGREPGARLYRSGDQARWTEEGTLQFLGRRDGQVKLRGYRIELGEIESMLCEHPAVAHAAVALKKTATDDKKLVGYIVQDDKFEGLAKEYANEAAAQVERWQSLYDETYAGDGQARELAHNFHGWNSSYTGQPIPEIEMREWQAATIARIRALNPRRVWEIGCGTGLLLGQLAPSCEAYCGTDFSASVLSQTRRLVSSQSALAHVTLEQRLADDFSGVPRGTYDGVVLNSVVQYFPSAAYLEKVVLEAANAVADGGFIYVGDVRSLPLLRAYAASVLAFQSSESTTRDALSTQVRYRVQQEEELVIEPEFFRALAARCPRIAAVEIAPKRGKYANELTRFRYEVVLRIATNQKSLRAPKTYDWRRDELTLEGIAELLERADQGEAIEITRIANARLAFEQDLVKWLTDAGDARTLGDLRHSFHPGEADPESVALLAERAGWAVQLDWSDSGEDGSFAALFVRPNAANAYAFTTSGASGTRIKRVYATNPLQNAFVRKLAPVLHAYLGERLPQYMVPSAFLLLGELPLNANGKVDRAALPLPEVDRSEQDGAYVAPRTDLEQTIADLFADVLGTQRVGVNDSFFNLGGHSLLATQLISRVRESCGVDCPLRVFFDCPTVAALAEAVQKMRSEAESGPDTMAIGKRAMSLEDQLAMLEESI